MNAKSKLNNGHGFWNFNLGHALTIVLVAVSVLGSYFKTDARVSAVENLSAKTAERLERIDDLGTRRSQLGLNQEMEILRSHTNRIEKLEEAVGVMSPKIERIDANIQWMVTNPQSRIQMPAQPQRHTGK